MSTVGMMDSTSASDCKYYNMKQFILAVKEFNKNKADDTANIINRHLQLLGVTIDTSIFDPHTAVASEFFVSLYKLLSFVEQRSSLTWSCVNVLSVTCRNPTARNALIHSYQFVPSLARLLGDHLTNERKIQLLQLMQELTCGIKITWQIPHLPHLMATLTKWVENDEEDIVALSLGVLVNLCYKNLPAIYTLSRCVDLKKFVRICMPLKGLKIEVHVCKLLIILDCLNGRVPENVFIKLTEVTFKSTIEAFRAGDAILLRHIVEFFLDVVEKSHKETVTQYGTYDEEVAKLLQIASDNDHGDSFQLDPECMALVFELLHFLVEQKLPKLLPLYPQIVSMAQTWIQTDIVCSQALNVLRTIAIAGPIDSAMLKSFTDSINVLIITLDSQEEIPTHTEYNKRINSLMQLLRALIENREVRARILEILTENTVKKILSPITGDGTRANSCDTSSMEAINLYVNTIVLVSELAKHDMEWVGLYNNLMRQKSIHLVLSQALHTGPKATKLLVLNLASNPFFPTEEIASTISDIQLSPHDGDKNIANTSTKNEFNFPVMSVAQLERLDEVMQRVNDSCKDNVLGAAISDVMELYEYKLASMGHAERAAVASVEAASERCTHLQHRLEQLSAELSRLHQLLFHSQKCYEEATKTRDTLQEQNREATNRLEAEKGRLKATCSQLSMKETALRETTNQLEETTKLLKETSGAKSLLEQQNQEFKRIVARLEENLIKKEKSVEKRDEQISRLSANCEQLNSQQAKLEKKLKQTEAALTAKETELSQTSKELETCRSILGTITKLTHSQFEKSSS